MLESHHNSQSEFSKGDSLSYQQIDSVISSNQRLLCPGQ